MKRRLHHHCSVAKQINTLCTHHSLTSVCAIWIIFNELQAEFLHYSVNHLPLTGESEPL